MENPKDWHTQLKHTLWIDQVRVKNALGTSPYFLIYRKEPVFPLHLKVAILKVMSGYVEEVDKVQTRLMNLLEIDKKWTGALEHMANHQAIIKRWFEKRARIKSFRIFYLVLLWDKAKEKLGSHTKFQHLWIGPYQIAEILGENTFRLSTLDGEYLPLPVNRRFLKHYFEA